MPVVYALGDPRTGEVRYVGIAQDVYKHYTQHLINPHSSRISAWMDEIKVAGIVPTLAVLESDVGEDLIFEREKYWIRYYLDLGASLLNVACTASDKQKQQIAACVEMPEKESYTLGELFGSLFISIPALAHQSGVSEATIREIRVGNIIGRFYLDKLLAAFSDLCHIPLSIDNIADVIITEIATLTVDQITDSEGACTILSERFGHKYEVNALHQLVKRDKLRAFVFQQGKLVERSHKVETRGRDLIFLKEDLAALPVPRVGKPPKQREQLLEQEVASGRARG